MSLQERPARYQGAGLDFALSYREVIPAGLLLCRTCVHAVDVYPHGGEIGQLGRIDGDFKAEAGYAFIFTSTRCECPG
jgi:hypothetical protein